MSDTLPCRGCGKPVPNPEQWPAEWFDAICPECLPRLRPGLAPSPTPPKSLAHPDYRIAGTPFLSLSRWSRENVPKDPPRFRVGDRVLVPAYVHRVYEDCDGTALFGVGHEAGPAQLFGYNNESTVLIPAAPGALITICRDIPGEHTGGRDCFCRPGVFAWDDDAGIRAFMADEPGHLA